MDAKSNKPSSAVLLLDVEDDWQDMQPRQASVELAAPEVRRVCWDSAHWHSDLTFRQVEKERRQRNAALHTGPPVFLSHSWRCYATQEKKRRIVSYLSAPPDQDHNGQQQEPPKKAVARQASAATGAGWGAGMVYWADWLDLQAEGPLPWRREIEEGIQQCSKFVALVDEAWLTSYNCLQELALAFHFGKPVVALVLDQEAWDLLTVPGGASLAKAAADAVATQPTHSLSVPNMKHASTERRMSRQTSAEAAWVSDKHADASLMRYRGEELIPGQAMSLEVVSDLFRRLSSINLCPCRQLEVETQGWDSMLATAQRYVQKDLVYFKEHAELLALETRWRRGDKANGKLLGQEDAVRWREWCRRAVADRYEPPPTAEMKEFVKASSSAVMRRRNLLSALSVIIAAVILGAAVASGILAVRSNRQAARAEEEAARARLAEKLARAETERALKATIDAVSLLSLSEVRQDYVSVPALWEVKVVNAVLDRLFGRGSAVADLLGMNAARHFARLGVPLMSVAAADLTSLSGSGDAAAGHRWFRAVWSSDGARLAFTGVTSPSVLVAPIRTDGPLMADGRQATHQVLHGHEGWVWALAWSPDGTHLASASRDGTVRLWQLSEDGLTMQGESVRVLEGHTDWVWTVAWSPDGSRLASGSYDRTVRLWSIHDGESIVLEGHTGSVLTLAWSKCGGLLASGGVDGTVRVWRVPVGNMVSNRNAPAYNPQLLNGHKGSSVWVLAWSPSGSMLAGLTGDQTLVVWPLIADGTVDDAKVQVVEQPNMFLSDERSEFVMSWAPNGMFITSASDDESVQLWRVAPDGSVELGHKLNGGASFVALAWEPSGHKLAAADEDGNRYSWGICPTRRLPLDIDKWLKDHTPPVTSVAWDPTGRILASASGLHAVSGAIGYTSSIIRLFRVSQVDGSVYPPGAVQILRPRSGSSIVWNSLAWSPDGTHLAAAGDPLGIWIWPVKDDGTVDATQSKILPLTRSSVVGKETVSNAAIAWSSDGRRLAVAIANENNASDATFGLAVWSVGSHQDDSTGISFADEPSRIQNGHSGPVNALAFSPDSSQLASGSADGTVRLWQVPSLELGRNTTMAPVLVFRRHGTRSVTALAWASGGEVLASSANDSSSTVLLWDAASGAILQTLVADRSAMVWSSLSFSRNGRGLAAGGSSGAFAVWPITGTEASIREADVQRRTHPGSGRNSVIVEWAPNGRHLATSAGLIAALLWPIDDSTQAPSLSEHPHGVLSDETTWDYLLGPNFGCDFNELGHAGLEEVCGLEDLVQQVLDGNADWVNAVSWSPSGRHLVSGGRDGTLRLWRTAQGGTVAVDEGGTSQVVGVVNSRGVVTLDWSSSGSHLAAGCVSGAVHIWDMSIGGDSIDTDSMRVLEGHTGEVLSVAWHPSEGLLASGGRDSSVRLWKLGQSGWVQTILLEGHTMFVTSLSWSPSGSRLASGSWDDSVRVWPVLLDTASEWVVDEGAVQSVALGADRGDMAVTWSPNGAHLAAARGLLLKLWPVSDGGGLVEEGVQVLEQRSVRVRALAWAPGGGQLAGGTDGGEVWVWHMDSLGKLLPHQMQRLEGHTQAVLGVRWSVTGAHLASGSRDRSVRVWAMGLHELKRVFGRAYTGLNLSLTQEDFSMNPIPQALATL